MTVLAAAFVIWATFAGPGASIASADVRVQGDVAAVQIEAKQSQISEVLSALGPALNVRYRTAISLDGAIDGTFKGPLRDVLSRVLDGFNYFVKAERDRIEVIVLGKRGEHAVPAALPQAPAAKSLAAKWRSTD
jgi:hypothetical protein